LHAVFYKDTKPFSPACLPKVLNKTSTAATRWLAGTLGLRGWQGFVVQTNACIRRCRPALGSVPLTPAR
jgi:hypothetical protein